MRQIKRASLALQRLIGSRKEAVYHIESGDRARDMADWPMAAKHYQTALSKDPLLAHIWVQYGNVTKEAGDPITAEKAYRRALELEPSNADTHLQLGHVLKIMGLTDLAVGAYSQSLALDPHQPYARAELVTQGWTEGDVASALGTELSGPLQYFLTGESSRKVNDSCYLSENADIRHLVQAKLVLSADQYERLYAQSDGRAVIESLARCPASRVIVLCPSFGKRCGIGQYAGYFVACLEQAGFAVTKIRRASELRELPLNEFRDAVLVVQHGPGLFDGYNPQLSEMESTTDLLGLLTHAFEAYGIRPIIYLHSMLRADNAEMYGRQQQILQSPLPKVTTIESAATYFGIGRVDHGIQPLGQLEASANRLPDDPKIGFFGFFQWGGKDFDALLQLIRLANGSLVGSVATSSDKDVDVLKGLFKEHQVSCNVGTGWVTDTELRERLSTADVYYLPQKDHNHWNNSGTARFVMNFGKPVLLPPHQPFLDMREGVIFADQYDTPKIIAWLRSADGYNAAVGRVRKFAQTNAMQLTAASVVKQLPKIFFEQRIEYFYKRAWSAAQLLTLPQQTFEARAEYMLGAPLTLPTSTTEQRSFILSQIQFGSPKHPIIRFAVAEDVCLWRRNYELTDFFCPNAPDIVFAIYRSLLKRDPTPQEYLSVREKHPYDQPTESSAASLIVDLLTTVLGKAEALSTAPLIEVAWDGSVLNSKVLVANRKQLLHEISIAYAVAQDTAVQYSTLQQTESEYFGDSNLIAMLLLPDASVETALSQLTLRIAGKDVSFSGVNKRTTLRHRIVHALHRLSIAGVRPSDVFVLDHPIVPTVETGRRRYALAEFLAFDGDPFIAATVRRLMKRDALPVEQVEFQHLLAKNGKLAVIKEIKSRFQANAEVVDLDTPESMAQGILSSDGSELRQIVTDFRSPVSGGIDARNSYLENKRNYEANWSLNKSHWERWRNFPRVAGNSNHWI